MDFKWCERQFDWLEISLVFEKSDKHLTIYDSYNAKCAAKMAKSIEQVNISDGYSPTNTMKFDTSNDTQKHMLWKQYAVWHCDGHSPAPISNYMNNPVFQEVLLKHDYFGTKSDKKVYIGQRESLGYTNEIEKPSRNDSKLTITIKLKNPLAHKMRIRVWGYTSGEYHYMLTDGGLTVIYKTYTIKSQDDALEA